MGHLDITATHTQLTTMFSASKHKIASMRWWRAARPSARKLRINREPPKSMKPRVGANRNANNSTADKFTVSAMPNGSVCSPSNSQSEFVNDKACEKLRPVWWLLSAIDPRLSLCFGQPLTPRHAECESAPANERQRLACKSLSIMVCKSLNMRS